MAGREASRYVAGATSVAGDVVGGCFLQRRELARLEVAPREGKAKQVGQAGAGFSLRHAEALCSLS